MSDTEHVVAHKAQEKFEFYGVALVFTILALSIQTADFSGHLAQRICELLAWLVLLIAGLVGLSRLEWNPVIRVQMARKDWLEAAKQRLADQKRQGVQDVMVLQDDKTVPIEHRIDEYQSTAEKLGTEISTLERRAEKKYLVFKWGLALGIALLVVSRSIDPVIGIVKELRP